MDSNFLTVLLKENYSSFIKEGINNGKTQFLKEKEVGYLLTKWDLVEISANKIDIFESTL